MLNRRLSVNPPGRLSEGRKTEGSQGTLAGVGISGCLLGSRIVLFLAFVGGLAFPATYSRGQSQMNYSSSPIRRPVGGQRGPQSFLSGYNRDSYNPASVPLTGIPRQGLTRDAYLRSTGKMDPSLTDTPLNRIGMASSMDGIGLSRQFSSGYHTWFQPEVVVRRQKSEGASDGEAERSAAMAGQRSLPEMTDRYMSARKQMYFTDGWRYFQDGDYRRAFEMFSLADRITLTDPEQRALDKLSQFHAAMAQGQYSVAAHALFWLLRPDGRTQRLVDPLFLLRIDNLPARYVSRQKFEEDVQQIVALARQSAEEVSRMRTPGMSEMDQRRLTAELVVPVRAMAAVMLWYRSRNEGEFYARSHLADTQVPEPWSRLPELMKLAMEEESRRPGALTSPLLPSLDRTESVMPWRLSPENPSSDR